MSLHKIKVSVPKIILLSFLCFWIAACGQPAEKQIKLEPMVFESSDECHVCGMLITKFRGPKGQAFGNRNKQVKKFCSTTALIFWYLQPENTHSVSQLYVHDMANTSWDAPDDQHLISAREAFYVIDSSMQGSMGRALASFSNAEDASGFAQQYGGRLISFDSLTLDSIAPDSSVP